MPDENCPSWRWRRTRGRAGWARVLVLASITCWPATGGAQLRAEDRAPDVDLFFQAAARDEREARAALDALGAGWRDGYAGMIVDIARLLPGAAPRLPTAFEGGALPGDDVRGGGDGAARGGYREPPVGAPAPPPVDPRRRRLIRFLEEKTGRRLGDDLRAWRRWIWGRPYEPHPDLAAFKAALYGGIDPRMAAFFAPGAPSRIRLDEVDWGGVKVNGIPPLDHPEAVPAAQARYLGDKNVVFGIFLNGAARAYPKRVLAWHELALDRVGGVELAVVYCTLCGTVVPYGASSGGKVFTFGTSGLLYRSNKLMFDHETSSLWSAVEGRPVIGPLAESALELRAFPVVTTSWGEWVKLHPGTTVLSLDTGHSRDYSEGAAYREYFATDRLMFEVPRDDGRLKNKAEVLALRVAPADADAGVAARPLAISVEALKRRPILQLRFAGRDLVVLTSAGGANRVYAVPPRTRFTRWPSDRILVDAEGRSWSVGEEALASERGGEVGPRLPARRAFWFGWHAQFPDTELVR